MTNTQLEQIIQQGEGTTIEFKSCTSELSSTVFETVCAFLNHYGGHLILGVKNSGEVVGVKNNCIESITKNFINIVNNSEQLNPTSFFSPEVFEIKGKKVIYIYVPESSEVHRFRGNVFERIGDSDNNITKRHNLIDNIYLRKRKMFTENEVLPFLAMEDLDDATFEKTRRLSSLFATNHPWKTMTNEEILHSSGFWQKDRETGKEGFILAALLLFGKENTISNYCPAYKTDAIYRNMTYNRFLHPLPHDPDIRYDDRDTIRVNLIEAYDRLMKFVHRNLPEKFYLPPTGSTQRKDIRSYIFREIVANTLVHREFSNSFPAKFLIFSDIVITENWTKPTGKSHISLDELDTYTKNPMITKIFKEIGHVEELGSGRKNILKYAPLYYKDYKIEVLNDEKFVFSISYRISTETTKRKKTSKDGELNPENGEVNPENGELNPDNGEVNPDNGEVNPDNGELNPDNGELNPKNGELRKKRKEISGVKEEELNKIIEIISETPGQKRQFFIEKIEKGKSTIDRYIKILKEAYIIEYIGSDKKGGYYLTKQAKKKLTRYRNK